MYDAFEEMRPETRRALYEEWRRLMGDTEEQRGASEPPSSPEEPVLSRPLSDLWHLSNASQRQPPKVPSSIPSEYRCEGNNEGEQMRQNGAEQRLKKWWRICGLDPQEVRS